MIRLGSWSVAAMVGAAACVMSVGPAAAEAPDKATLLSTWTQPSTSSYNGWNAARRNQGAWAHYAFDWSTDYCTASPDNPLGFDFTLACYRHDFGYRNYRAAGQFDANKTRIDNALYQDLSRKCATYNVLVQPACSSLAQTYYQAVRQWGVTRVDQADLDRAARIKADAERSANGR